MSDILQRDGLTLDLLAKLSYKSELGINLKKFNIKRIFNRKHYILLQIEVKNMIFSSVHKEKWSSQTF